MEDNNYAGSSTSRPKVVEKGGKGTYCCIPECKSSSYTNEMVKTGIGFFTFPKDKTLNNQWRRVVNMYRRKGAGDKFKINSSTVVCEFHFDPKDIRVTLGRGIKKLQPGVIPSIFPLKAKHTVQKRRSPRKRIIPSEVDVDMNLSEENNIESNVIDPKDIEIKELKQQIVELKKQNAIYADEIKKIQTSTYCYENISNNNELFKSETGLTKDTFDELFTLLDVKENCDNIKFYDSNLKKSETLTSPTNRKQGPKVKLDVKDQLFLVISWLKGGFSLKHVSWLFGLTKSTTSRYIITWINLMYFTLGAIPIWPSKAQIKETTPKSFQESYPTTRCIIDCTELFCQRPSSLSTQSHMYSHYKSHATYKGLLGIAPSGSITFVSQLYEGSISDKEIVDRSGLLNENLWENNDSIMADRGFTITDLLKPLNIKLNIYTIIS